MVKRIGTQRHKTRDLFSVSKKMKGKLPVSEFFKKLAVGEKVQLVAQPSILKGMYFRRFHGKTGTVTGMQGACYTVVVRDGGQHKTLVIGPVHLQKAK